MMDEATKSRKDDEANFGLKRDETSFGSKIRRNSKDEPSFRRNSKDGGSDITR